MNCPQCGAPVDNGAKNCKYCGEAIIIPQQMPQQMPQQYPMQNNSIPNQMMNQVGQMFNQNAQNLNYDPTWPSKNRVTASLLAIFLGDFGVHKFYMGEIGLGILYLIFSWSCIPAIIGLIEGITWLTMSNEKFAMKYHVKPD